LLNSFTRMGASIHLDSLTNFGKILSIAGAEWAFMLSMQLLTSSKVIS